MKDNISIILVDDHTIVRNALKTLIESMSGYKVINDFENGRALINQIPFKETPDIIIMDIAMPEMDGKQTMKWLKQNNNTIPVLILTLDTTEKTIIELFKSGVRGYIPKTCSAQELKKAIDGIVETGFYHNEFMTIALQAAQEGVINERDLVLKKITEREMQFLRLVCNEQEYTYQQMADIMDVHRRTIDGYRESLFDKFKIKSKTGLVLFALKYGLLDVTVK